MKLLSRVFSRLSGFLLALLLIASLFSLFPLIGVFPCDSDCYRVLYTHLLVCLLSSVAGLLVGDLVGRYRSSLVRKSAYREVREDKGNRGW